MSDKINAAVGERCVYAAAFDQSTARSKRSATPFTHAWRVSYVVGDRLSFAEGFCSSLELAEEAAARFAKLIWPARKTSAARLEGVEIVEARPTA